MPADNYTGWDIGGAHLKIARLDKNGVLTALRQFATPLWQGIDTLDGPVTRMADTTDFGDCIHALTMTGELVDYFPGRKEGVMQLVDYMSARLGRINPLYVYAGAKGMIAPDRVAACHEEIASANWHATAAFVAKCMDSGVLIDIGTTTTDLIPFDAGRVCSRGYSDQERMQTDELVYTGIVRTPVMAIVERLPYKNVWQSIAAEYFATMADVYRITGELDEDFDLMPATDGGGKTRYDSVKRLARMLGTDYNRNDDMTPWLDVANHIADKQFEKIDKAFMGLRTRRGETLTGKIVAAGAGRFIIEKLAKKHDCDVVGFEDLLRLSDRKLHGVNNCATAVAVAQLTRMAINR